MHCWGKVSEHRAAFLLILCRMLKRKYSVTLFLQIKMLTKQIYIVGQIEISHQLISWDIIYITYLSHRNISPTKFVRYHSFCYCYPVRVLFFQIFLLDGIYFRQSVDPLVLDWIPRLLDASLHCCQCFLHLWNESPICRKVSFSINVLLEHFINWIF